MALISCPACNKKISESADFCPNCGYHITQEVIRQVRRDKPGSTSKGCAIGCFAVIALGFFLFLIGPCSGSDSTTNATKGRARPVVENSAWDGSVSQVKRWLEANAKDPSSLEYIEWSSVQKSAEGGFVVRVKYRGKNSFGGYTVENKVFVLNAAGSVTEVMDF